MLELVHLPYSPWSERARWALDHHGIAYESKPYLPMVGALPLRLRLRRFSGRVTVPVLFTPHGALADSTDIARFADRIGKGTELIPRDREGEVVDWITKTELLMQAGRNLVTRRTGRSPEALREQLPSPLRALGPVGGAIARSGVDYFVRKYDLTSRSEERDLEDAVQGLDELRAALGGRPTIFDAFSYADIVTSGMLQIVEALPDRYIRLGPATRAVWETPELKARFPDLVEWRDRLYAEHRGDRARRKAA